MRFLGVGETGDLGALYLALRAEGHEVRVAISEPAAQGTLAGLVERVANWTDQLDWVRAAGADGIILFESVSEGFGLLQDDLRARGFNVIGGSRFGDRLENDRAFAQALLVDIGFPAAEVKEFDKAEDAVAFVRARPGRWVLKLCGPDHSATDTYVGQLSDGADVIAMLECSKIAPHKRFILMEFLAGVEMGVGAYFDGDSFVLPACLDWEHKRFFPGDLGELTGEMGTVATYDRSETFFRATLARLEPILRANGYHGYINLNTIVNKHGIWPLEFTCRFGYPGFAVLAPLQETSWSELFAILVRRSQRRFQTRSGFCVGVVLTTPPFPYTREQLDDPIGLPVLISDNEPDHFHYGEIGCNDSGQLVTSGLYGWTMVVTGRGPNIAEAQRAAYARVARVFTPNLRYRNDIGNRLIAGELTIIEELGLLDVKAGRSH